jgi:hypothetical protein
MLPYTTPHDNQKQLNRQIPSLASRRIQQPIVAQTKGWCIPYKAIHNR